MEMKKWKKVKNNKNATMKIKKRGKERRGM